MLRLSLFFFFSCFSCVRPVFLHHVPRVARTYITMPHVRSHPHPLQSTSSFTTDQCAIVDPNPLRVSQSRTGASYNVALPSDNITVRMGITLHFWRFHIKMYICISRYLQLFSFEIISKYSDVYFNFICCKLKFLIY